jgi:nuclear pore complex protein Nup205
MFCPIKARNADDRNAVRQANRVGLAVQATDGVASSSLQVLSTDFITEALTISDLFDLNEIASVELLMAGK